MAIMKISEFQGVPVKFSAEKDLDDETCWSLLDKYMPDYIKERKISQKLFIKSMMIYFDLK